MESYKRTVGKAIPAPMRLYKWLRSRPTGKILLSKVISTLTWTRESATSLLAAVLIFYTPVPVLAVTDLEFNEIADGIYLHVGSHQDMGPGNAGDIANIGFVVGNRSVAIIDPGGSPQIGAALRKAVGTVTDLTISHVILTHVHPDHIFGASAFDDVQYIVAHRNFPRALAQRADFYRNRYRELFSGSDTPITLLPTVIVDETLNIDLGGRTLSVRAHRSAHTDNDLSIFDPQSGVLWASDLLFGERIPSLDGSLKGWLEVMNELSRLPAGLVVPGHGQAGSWEALAKPQSRYLNALLSETRQAIRDNRKLSRAVEEVAIEEARKWQLFEIHHRGNVTRAYTELEWE